MTTQECQSDEALVAAWNAGDATALAEIWRRHAPAMHRAARRYLPCPADADAALAASLVYLGDGGLSRWRGDCPLPGYLCLVARSRAMNLRRNQQRCRSVETSIDEHAAGHRKIDVPDLRAPDLLAMRAERLAEVMAALRSLPARDQEIIGFYAFDDCDYETIRLRCGLATIGTVKSRLSRARAALRQALVQPVDGFPQAGRVVVV